MSVEVLIFAVLALIAGLSIGGIVTWLYLKLQHYKENKNTRADAIERSKLVLRGQLTEQLAPLLPDFPFSPHDVRFLGKPIDFIAFPGLEEDNPTEIVFLEIKSGEAKLSKRQEKLKELVKHKRVRWEEYRKE